MRWVRGVFGVLAIVGVWYVARAGEVVPRPFLPAFHDVLFRMTELLTAGEAWNHIGASMWRIVVSFLIGSAIGSVAGLVVGSWRKLEDGLSVIIDFFRSLPALAVFPLFLVVLGLGDGAKIATTVLACGLVILVNTIYGVRSVSSKRIATAEMLGANQRDVFLNVTVWEALPHIVAGMRIGLSLAVAIVIVTEMFVGTEAGIGQEIYDAQLTYRMEDMYSYIVYAGLVGYGLNVVFVHLERRVTHWSESERVN